MARFLQGHATDSIAWLERKETKADLTERFRRPNDALRTRLILPLAVGRMVISRFFGSLHTSLLRRLGLIRRKDDDQMPTRERSRSQSVVFEDASTAFPREGRTRYLLGALCTGFVDVLRSLNLLL